MDDATVKDIYAKLELIQKAIHAMDVRLERWDVSMVSKQRWCDKLFTELTSKVADHDSAIYGDENKAGYNERIKNIERLIRYVRYHAAAFWTVALVIIGRIGYDWVSKIIERLN